MPTATHEGLETRASLLGRVKDPDDAAAWEEFDRLYRRLVRSVALQKGLQPHEADDIAQETMRSVAVALPGFEYDPTRCHFRTWLQTLVKRRIVDHFRDRRAAIPAGPAAEDDKASMTRDRRAVEARSSPMEAIWDSEWEQAIVQTAWNRLRSLVKPLQFQVLHLRLREERSFREIARILGLSLNSVYLSRMRTGRVFRRLVREAKREADLRDEQVIRSAHNYGARRPTVRPRR